MASPLTERLKVASKKAKRWPMHRSIRHLTAWDKLSAPESGYTVILGCMRDLPRVAIANLEQIRTMHSPRMRELLLSFDCTGQHVPPEVSDWCREHKDVPVRIVNYSPKQERVTRRIDWGWVYCWLSWCNAVAQVRTEHYLLHDLDALPLDRQLFEKRYDDALASDADFHGTCWYDGYGVTEDMQLARTFVMVGKSQFLRNHKQPFDVFNQLEFYDGHYVDFDTFLDVQRHAQRAITALPESDLFHPTQMISQHVDFMNGRDPMRRPHNLLLMPYLAYLGGDEDWLPAIAEELSDPAATEVFYRGRLLPITGLSGALWAWLEKQVRRIEQANFGHTRDVVEAFLTGFIHRAGADRTVGRESGAFAVAER